MILVALMTRKTSHGRKLSLTSPMPPDDGLSEHSFVAKGHLLGGGLSGIVELLPNGHVIKTPWPGEDNLESQQDMKTEAQIYEKLAEHVGTHPRFIQSVVFDPDRLTLTMEYMSNGTLRDYLRANNQHVTRQQRHSWIYAMAEGLEVLHDLDILHCDLTPHNILLDDKLQIKIADFGCSSIDGSSSLAGTNSRFYPPRTSWSSPVTSTDDLFALGSCIYEILTGAAPFREMPSPLARTLVALQQFPDLTGLDCGPIIRDCWLLQADSARCIRSRISAELE